GEGRERAAILAGFPPRREVGAIVRVRATKDGGESLAGRERAQLGEELALAVVAAIGRIVAEARIFQLGGGHDAPPSPDPPRLGERAFELGARVRIRA